MADDNPLEITEFKQDGDEEGRMFVPLDKLPEDIVEELRKRFLEPSTAEQRERDEAPPGVKNNAMAEEQKRQLDEALANAREDSDAPAASPSDALG